MNVLFVTAYPPVLHMHGGGVRMYHNIRILSQRHSVRVISFVDSDEERELLKPVRSICDSVTAVRRVPDFRPHWLSLLPFMVREFSTPEMHRAVDEAIRSAKIDVLHCEYLQMAQFRRRRVFTVLTAHEALSKNAADAFARELDPTEKLRLFYRWMQMLRYEVTETRRFDRVVTMTKDDARYLRTYSPGANIRAIPIGVDTEEFQPLPEVHDQPLTVLFVGNFRHSPNIEAAQFLVNVIAPRFPEVRFVLPGSHVPPGLAGANVIFPGYIADTRELYLRPNTIVAAPLFSGTGQRVKLLEAFSMACPVITTTVGAMGFPIENGIHAVIANNAEEFGKALRAMIASVEYRKRLGMQARQMMLDQFSWDRLAEDFLCVVEEAAVPH